MSKKPEEKLLSISESSRQSGTSVTTLRAKIANGTLKAKETILNGSPVKLIAWSDLEKLGLVKTDKTAEIKEEMKRELDQVARAKDSELARLRQELDQVKLELDKTANELANKLELIEVLKQTEVHALERETKDRALIESVLEKLSESTEALNSQAQSLSAASLAFSQKREIEADQTEGKRRGFFRR